MLTWDDVARVCLALPATTEVTSANGRRRAALVAAQPLHSPTELVADAWASRAPRRLLATHALVRD